MTAVEDRVAEARVARLERLAGRVTAAVDRRPRVTLAVLVGIVVVAALRTATAKLLWNDELFTYYFARLPSFGDVWTQLHSGAEQTPPLFYLVTRAAIAVAGAGRVALRVPELAGGVLTTVCLFRFVARRSAAVPGAVAVLFTVVAASFYYVSEARPYGLVLGLAALALCCWGPATAPGPRRGWALLGLAAGLAGAAAMQYYGALVVVPFAVGELLRIRDRRRLDPPLLAALAAGPLAVLPAVPLLASAQGYSAHFWAKPSLSTAPDLYRYLLTPGVGWLLVGVVVAAGLAAVLRPGRRVQGATPAHELAVLVTFVALPLIGTIGALLVTGAFTSRYALPGVLGVAGLLGLATGRLHRITPVAGAVLLAVFAVWAAVEARHDTNAARFQAHVRRSTLAFLDRRAAAGQPVVVASGHDFLELSHDAAAAGGRPRLLYLADPRSAIRVIGTDTIDRGILELRNFAPLDVASYPAYARRGRSFELLSGGTWDWLTAALHRRGARMTVVARQDGRTLYRVRLS
jgi:hypothetical protein